MKKEELETCLKQTLNENALLKEQFSSISQVNKELVSEITSLKLIMDEMLAEKSPKENKNSRKRKKLSHDISPSPSLSEENTIEVDPLMDIPSTSQPCDDSPLNV